MGEEQKQFACWALVLRFQMCVATCPFRSHSWLHKVPGVTLHTYTNWNVVVDYGNYVRWFSLHIHDMWQCMLETWETVVFKDGALIVPKTKRKRPLKSTPLTAQASQHVPRATMRARAEDVFGDEATISRLAAGLWFEKEKIKECKVRHLSHLRCPRKLQY